MDLATGLRLYLDPPPGAPRAGDKVRTDAAGLCLEPPPGAPRAGENARTDIALGLRLYLEPPPGGAPRGVVAPPERGDVASRGTLEAGLVLNVRGPRPRPVQRVHCTWPAREYSNANCMITASAVHGSERRRTAAAEAPPPSYALAYK